MTVSIVAVSDTVDAAAVAVAVVVCLINLLGLAWLCFPSFVVCSCLWMEFFGFFLEGVQKDFFRVSFSRTWGSQGGKIPRRRLAWVWPSVQGTGSPYVRASTCFCCHITREPSESR